jgi:hypothetical protein
LCHRRSDPPWRVFRPVSDLSPKSFLALEIGDEDRKVSVNPLRPLAFTKAGG